MILSIEKFIPSFAIPNPDNENFEIIFRYESAYAVHHIIESIVTDSLGYNQIRPEGEGNETYEDLQNHLFEMGKRIEERRQNLFTSAFMSLIYETSSLENYCNELAGELNNFIKETSKERKAYKEIKNIFKKYN